MASLGIFYPLIWIEILYREIRDIIWYRNSIIISLLRQWEESQIDAIYLICQLFPIRLLVPKIYNHGYHEYGALVCYTDLKHAFLTYRRGPIARHPHAQDDLQHWDVDCAAPITQATSQSTFSCHDNDMTWNRTLCEGTQPLTTFKRQG